MGVFAWVKKLFGGEPLEVRHFVATAALPAVQKPAETLVPAIKTQWTDLVPCKSCGAQLSVLAQACPKCGAPNNWQHPVIERFHADRASIRARRAFTFHASKTKVWGATASFVPIWANALAMLISVTGVFAGLLLGGWFSIGVAVGLVILVMSTTSRRETFEADLQAGSWASSNDRFWQPVRSRLFEPRP